MMGCVAVAVGIGDIRRSCNSRHPKHRSDIRCRRHDTSPRLCDDVTINARRPSAQSRRARRSARNSHAAAWVRATAKFACRRRSMRVGHVRRYVSSRRAESSRTSRNAASRNVGPTAVMRDRKSRRNVGPGTRSCVCARRPASVRNSRSAALPPCSGPESTSRQTARARPRRARRRPPDGCARPALSDPARTSGRNERHSRRP